MSEISKERLLIGRKKISSDQAIALLVVFAFKLSLEYGYYAYLIHTQFTEYTLDFSMWKYVNGVACLVAIVLAIDVGNGRVSSFLLFLQMMIGVVPLSVMYAMENSSFLYFNSVCLAYYVACVIVNTKFGSGEKHRLAIPNMDAVILVSILGLVAMVTAYYYLHNGLPKSWVPDFSNVYKLRATSIVIANKYVGYAVNIVVDAGLPLLIAFSLEHRKRLLALVWFALFYVYFIYSGNKTMIFAIPLIIVVYLFARKGDCTLKIFSLLTAGVALLTALLQLTGKHIFTVVYSYIVRRIFLFPADIKFNYYDYFLTHPKTGLAGLPFFGSFFVTDTTKIGKTIATIYYHSTEMNANTGFLVEGFERFGYVGILIVMIIFAMVLKLLDSMQEQTGYTITLTMSAYIIYTLNDAGLISLFLAGPMTALVLIAIFFYDRRYAKINDPAGLLRGNMVSSNMHGGAIR